MTRLLNASLTKKAVLGFAAAIGLGSVVLTPQKANADFHIGFDIRDSGWQRPQYEHRATKVWVEPVYRTVCDRVWVAPTYQNVTERVWVPDRFEDRQILCYDGWRRRVEIQRVLIAPAHYEDRCRQVLVADGHWQEVQRQELVAAGHWEIREDRVAYAPPGPSEHFHAEFGHR